MIGFTTSLPHTTSPNWKDFSQPGKSLNEAPGLSSHYAGDFHQLSENTMEFKILLLTFVLRLLCGVVWQRRRPSGWDWQEFTKVYYLGMISRVSCRCSQQFYLRSSRGWSRSPQPVETLWQEHCQWHTSQPAAMGQNSPGPACTGTAASASAPVRWGWAGEAPSGWSLKLVLESHCTSHCWYKSAEPL